MLRRKPYPIPKNGAQSESLKIPTLLGFWCGDLPQQRHGLRTSGCVQGIVGPFSLLAAGHYTGFAQYFHMIGQAGLGKLQLILELAGAELTTAKQFQNFQSVGVTKRLENPSLLLIYCLHPVHPQIKNF